MKSVRVDRQELLTVMIANRDRHVEQLKAAREGYRRELQDGLVAALAQLDTGNLDGIHKALGKIQKPDDHTVDYNRAIDMMQMSKDDIVELTESDFWQYVRDEWSWRQQWTAMNSKYLPGS